MGVDRSDSRDVTSSKFFRVVTSSKAFKNKTWQLSQSFCRWNSLDFWICLRRCHCWAVSSGMTMWPDVAKFHHLGDFFHSLAVFWVYLLFGEVLGNFWVLFMLRANILFSHLVKILANSVKTLAKIWPNHLVTLDVTHTEIDVFFVI